MPKTEINSEDTNEVELEKVVWTQEAFEAAGYTEILPRTDFSIHDAQAVLRAEAQMDGAAVTEVVGKSED